MRNGSGEGRKVRIGYSPGSRFDRGLNGSLAAGSASRRRCKLQARGTGSRPPAPIVVVHAHPGVLWPYLVRLFLRILSTVVEIVDPQKLVALLLPQEVPFLLQSALPLVLQSPLADRDRIRARRCVRLP